MPTCIALLRGVNVGGRNKLTMQDLVRDLESLKLTDVRTYIQSGNVVFETTRTSTKRLANAIADTIEDHHGFRPHVLVLTAPQFAEIIAANPFSKAAAQPKSLHVFFLDAPAGEADLDALKQLKAKTERYKLTDAALYLHAPDGIGRSKLAARAERHLGVAATARNWRTVQKLMDMAEGG